MRPMDELPLRERSKLRRRAAIQRAAMRLFAERGYDATTVADIAAAADVATRSVSDYFPSKLDIALSSSNAASERLLTAIQVRAPEDPFVETFIDWLEQETEFVDAEEWRLRAAMFAVNPGLGTGGSMLTVVLTQTAMSALADELDVAPDHVATQVCFGLFAGVMLQCLALPERSEAASSIDTVRAALDGVLANVARRLCLAD